MFYVPEERKMLMNMPWLRKASLLSLLTGCWLLFLLAACGSATTAGSGNLVPKVTPVSTLTPSPMKLVLTFACQGGFTPSSTHEKICVRTLPDSSLTIKVTYCTGSMDQSNALQGTFTADKTGSYEWNWTPKATCQGNPSGTTGFWKGTAEVTATRGEQSLRSNVSFMV